MFSYPFGHIGSLAKRIMHLCVAFKNPAFEASINRSILFQNGRQLSIHWTESILNLIKVKYLNLITAVTWLMAIFIVIYESTSTATTRSSIKIVFLSQLNF